MTLALWIAFGLTCAAYFVALALACLRPRNRHPDFIQYLTAPYVAVQAVPKPKRAELINWRTKVRKDGGRK